LRSRNLATPPNVYPNADFNLIYTGLSWTDGSMHTLAWQATSSYSSVAIALVDAQNQTVSDFGSYGKLLFTFALKIFKL
jgi:hypothetical protein